MTTNIRNYLSYEHDGQRAVVQIDITDISLYQIEQQVRRNVDLDTLGARGDILIVLNDVYALIENIRIAFTSFRFLREGRVVLELCWHDPSQERLKPPYTSITLDLDKMNADINMNSIGNDATGVEMVLGFAMISFVAWGSFQVIKWAFFSRKS